LRHIAFLGAAPPAIKGLSNIKFTEEDDLITLEFSEQKDSNKRKIKKKEGREMTFKEKCIEFYQSMSESEFAEWFKGQKHSIESPKKKDEPVTFSEADMKKATDEAIAQAVKETKDKTAKEYAEKEEALRVSKVKEEIKTFCDDKKVIGRWRKMGILEYMESLINDDATIEFCEGKKSSRLDWFKDFVTDLPNVINFEEFAKREDNTDDLSEGDKLDAYIVKKMASNKELTYTEALDIVQREHPKLAAAYSETVTKH
jgi:hypothetical protein